MLKSAILKILSHLPTSISGYFVDTGSTQTISGTKTITGPTTFSNVGTGAGTAPVTVTDGNANSSGALYWSAGAFNIDAIGAGAGSNNMILRSGGNIVMYGSTSGIVMGYATQFNGAISSIPATVQDIATGNTIALPTTFNKRLTATAGAATGVIMTAGTVDGQTIQLFNVHATNLITFAAAGTSNVADGVSTTIPALTGIKLVWDTTSSRWYTLK